MVINKILNIMSIHTAWIMLLRQLKWFFSHFTTKRIAKWNIFDQVSLRFSQFLIEMIVVWYMCVKWQQQQKKTFFFFYSTFSLCTQKSMTSTCECADWFLLNTFPFFALQRIGNWLPNERHLDFLMTQRVFFIFNFISITKSQSLEKKSKLDIR